METIILPKVLFGPVAFVITFAMNWIASRERDTERQSRMSKSMKYSFYSANWSSVFEIILFVDLILTVADPLAILPWVLVGGWLGQFLAVEKQRRRFQTRKRRTRRPKPQPPQEGCNAGDTAAGVCADARPERAARYAHQ